MRKASFKYRAAVLFCSNMLLQIMGFVYRMALARYAGASALGLNSLIMQVYGIIVSFCISGLNVAVSGISAKLSHDSIPKLTSSAVTIFIVLWCAMALPTLTLSSGIARTAFGDAALSRTLVLMLFCIFMTGLENILKSVHIGTGNVRQCAASELCEQGIRFTLVVLLLKSFGSGSDPQTVFLIMLGMVFSEFVSVGFLSISFFKLFFKERRPIKSPSYIRELAGVAFPASLTAAASTLFASIGALILPRMLTAYGFSHAEALARIGVLNNAAIPVTTFPMAFVGAIASALMPEISGRLEAGLKVDTLVRKGLKAAAAAGVLSTLALGATAERIVTLFFGECPERVVLLLLLIKSFAIFIKVVCISVLNGFMKQKLVLAASVAGEVYQLALIFLLVPVLGMPGYALSGAAGELLSLALCLISIFNIRRKSMEIAHGIC